MEGSRERSIKRQSECALELGIAEPVTRKHIVVLSSGAFCHFDPLVVQCCVDVFILFSTVVDRAMEASVPMSFAQLHKMYSSFFVFCTFPRLTTTTMC